MPPPQTRVPRTTYTTYTYRPRRTTSETAKFQAANIQLAGGWWMTKQSYHNLPSHKRLDTHAGGRRYQKNRRHQWFCRRQPAGHWGAEPAPHHHRRCHASGEGPASLT